LPRCYSRCPSAQAQLNQYFEALIENPSGVRSLEDLIKFNDAHAELEEPAGYEDQYVYVFRLFYSTGSVRLTRSSLIEAQNTSISDSDAAYIKALTFNRELGSTRGIDFALKKHNLDALVLPADGYAAGPAGTADILIFLTYFDAPPS
jgi:amidase